MYCSNDTAPPPPPPHASARFRYSAALVPWTDAELDKLHKVWLQVHRVAWRLPPGFPSAPFVLPEKQGCIPLAHPRVAIVQALTTHIEQLCALPDEMQQTSIHRYRRLCDRCGCHNERELAEHLSSRATAQWCPIARLCTPAEDMLTAGGPNPTSSLPLLGKKAAGVKLA
jgi:hypothetical protein